LRANAENKPELIKEVTSLLSEIRGAWVAIGPEIRSSVVVAASGR